MFQQLLEDLKKIQKEVADVVNKKQQLEEDVDALTENVKTLQEEIVNHVCEKEIVEVPVEVLIPCNHEEEIEVLKSQVASITAEKEELERQNEENIKALQAEIEQLKKILATN